MKIKLIKTSECTWDISVNGEILGDCERFTKIGTFYRGVVKGEKIKAFSQKLLKEKIAEVIK